MHLYIHILDSRLILDSSIYECLVVSNSLQIDNTLLLVVFNDEIDIHFLSSFSFLSLFLFYPFLIFLKSFILICIYVVWLVSWNLNGWNKGEGGYLQSSFCIMYIYICDCTFWATFIYCLVFLGFFFLLFFSSFSFLLNLVVVFHEISIDNQLSEKYEKKIHHCSYFFFFTYIYWHGMW